MTQFKESIPEEASSQEAGVRNVNGDDKSGSAMESGGAAFIRGLSGFFATLRIAGLQAGLSECIDAVRAMLCVPTEDKSAVCYAMRACLAKSDEEREIFDGIFLAYFIDSGVRTEHIKAVIEENEAAKAEILNSVAELKFQDEPIELEDSLKEVYHGMSPEEKQSIRDFLEKTSAGKNVGEKFYDITADILKRRISRQRDMLPEKGKDYSGTFSMDNSEAGILAGEVLGEIEASQGLLKKRILDMDDVEIDEAVRLVRRIITRLKLRLSKKSRSVSRRTKLDMRGTLRKNLSTGGVLFHLKYKRRRRQRERLLLFCDVSASMYRYSGFIVNFASQMNYYFKMIQTYVFSEDYERLNTAQSVNYYNLRDVIVASKLWKKGTNIGKSVGAFLEKEKYAVGKTSIVLIVSDGKTVNAAKTAEMLEMLSGKVKRIIWLNPEPESRWDRIAGMDRYTKVCAVLDTSSIDKLRKACEEFLFQ